MQLTFDLFPVRRQDDYADLDLQRILLSLIDHEWVGFIFLVRTTGFKADAVNLALSALVNDGCLERCELYHGPHTTPDRLTRPPMMRPRLKGGKLGPSKYQGFEWGYRRRLQA